MKSANKSISTMISRETHVIISLINGIGDSFLALPAIKYVIDLHCPEFVVVWAPQDVTTTVLRGLPCCFVPIHFDRFQEYPFYEEESDLAGAILALENRAPLFWVSLNAYYPLWPIEKRLRAALSPQYAWDFGERPELFAFADDGYSSKKHMQEQYFCVMGESIRDLAYLRKPIARTRYRKYVEAFIKRISKEFDGYVTIHTDTLPGKSWQAQEWATLAQKLRAENNLATVVLGKPIEAPKDNSFIFVAPFHWHLQMALLEQSRAFIGIDSCWAHVADAFNLPGVVLFGKDSSVEEWGPRGPNMRAFLAPDGFLNKIDAQHIWDYLTVNRLFTGE